MQMAPYEGGGSKSRISQSRGTVVPGGSRTTSRVAHSGGGAIIGQQVGATEVWTNHETGEVAKFKPIQLLQASSSSLSRSESRSRYSLFHQSSSHRALPISASSGAISPVNPSRMVPLGALGAGSTAGGATVSCSHGGARCQCGKYALPSSGGSGGHHTSSGVHYFN